MISFNKIPFFLFSFLCGLIGVLYTFPAVALGQKVVKDASYYVHDLNDPATAQKTAQEVISPRIILVKCGNPERNPTGIAVMETGEIYGYDDFKPLQYIDFATQTLLSTDKTATDPLFAYADKIGLEKITFNHFEANTEMCVIEYQKDNQIYITRWVKHPYLREMNPPPQELLTLFQSVQDVTSVLKKEQK